MLADSVASSPPPQHAVFCRSPCLEKQVQQNQSVMSTQPRVMLTPQGELTLARARLASEIFARKAAQDDIAALQEELAETKVGDEFIITRSMSEGLSY